MTLRLKLCAAVVLSVASSATLLAQQPQQSYSSGVVSKCSPDAVRLCPEHALGSSEMRYCMEAKSKQLSKDCLIALEDEGLVPRGTTKRQAGLRP
jgi:hypothetical protein